MKIAVVDDERPARSELTYLIKNILPDAQILEAHSGALALELFLAAPDLSLAFLDINLNDMEGTTLAATLLKLLPDVPFVFATAYSDYAVRAFEMGAADYLLKPFDQERVRTILGKCLPSGIRSAALQDPMEGRIPISFNRKVVFLEAKDIIYIETSERCCLIHSTGGDFMENTIIGDYENRLAPYGFFRIHKSYLVNIRHITEVFPWANNNLALKLRGCEKVILPIGREKLKAFRQTMKL